MRIGIGVLWRAALVAAALALSGTGAAAQEPGYYRVTGVAADDVLNIRAEPGAGAEIVGELAPDASPVEVLEVVASGSTAWGRVLGDDANGWVSMSFLAPAAVATVGGTEIPAGLRCVGTEPFWDAEISQASITFSALDVDAASLPLESAMTAIARRFRYALVARGGEARFTATLASGEVCSDGMSDRDFGWRVDFIVEGPGAEMPRLYEGCCFLPVGK